MMKIIANDAQTPGGSAVAVREDLAPDVPRRSRRALS